MRTPSTSTRLPRRQNLLEMPNHLVALLSTRVVGQPAAMYTIVPYIQMHQAGLAAEGRPLGVFLLLGPTGTGKTKTVEALAEVLHGSEKNIVRIDCGEFQMEHEVAKLIGAPPGYLGHRETQPLLTQQKLNASATENSDITLVLFDEIEKAASSMTRLLLGILDKATLRLGDNSSVNFDKCLIFMTSNLGAKGMSRALNPDFGFEAMVPKSETPAAVDGEITRRLESIGIAAMKAKFAPEFVNRIDAVITYQPLDGDSLARIVDHQLTALQNHIDARLGSRGFQFEISSESRKFLLRKGTSSEYGAREVKRTIHRNLTQPMAAMAASGKLPPGALVKVSVSGDGERLMLKVFIPGNMDSAA